MKSKEWYLKIILFMIVIVFVTCKQNNLTVDNIKGTCKSIEESIYSIEEKFGEWKPVTLLWKEQYEYDEDGFLKSKTRSDQKGNILYKIKYHNITPSEKSEFSNIITKMQDDYHKYWLEKNIIYNLLGPKRIGFYYDSLGQNTKIILVLNTFTDNSDLEEMEAQYYFSKENGNLSLTGCDISFLQNNNLGEFPRSASISINDIDSSWVYREMKYRRTEKEIKDLDNNADILRIIKRGNDLNDFESYNKISNYSRNGFSMIDQLKYNKGNYYSDFIDIKLLEYDEHDNWVKKVKIITDYYSAIDPHKAEMGLRKSSYITRKITYY